MASTVKWRGSRDLQVVPDSTVFGKTATRVTWEQTRIGPFLSCLAAEPRNGQPIAGLTGPYSNVRVVESKITKKRGTIATLWLRAEYVINWNDLDTNPTTDNGTPELEWVQVERPLMTHPDFAPDGFLGGDQVGGTSARWRLSAADPFEIQAWQDEPSNVLRKDFKFTGEDGSIKTLTANAQIVAKLMVVGVTSWLDFAPVVRDTVRTSRPPTDGTCGTIYTAAALRSEVGFRVPSGYEFLKSADRGTQSGSNGRWERQREFMGARQWSRRLYRERR